MGSVLTPAYVGVENALDLPHAATLCGACHVACPVRIPLPDLLRTLREQQVERKLRPWRERAGLVLWRFVAQRPMLYAALSGLAARVLHWMGGRDGLIASLPGAPGWSIGRDMPAPAGQTFRAQYAARQHAQR
jgi:L-lactate dehydrogenase complex protein LldF